MLLVTGNRDAPRKRGPAHRQIAKSAPDKRNHLITTCIRTDEIRILRIELEQWLFHRRQLEEVILFMHGFCRPAALRAGSTRFGYINVKLVGDAILPTIVAFIEVTAFL